MTVGDSNVCALGCWGMALGGVKRRHSFELHRMDDPHQFRVKRPELLNLLNLDYSDHMFAFLGPLFFKWGLEENMERNFDYDEVTIDFAAEAETFEEQYLIGNEIPSCPDDE